MEDRLNTGLEERLEGIASLDSKQKEMHQEYLSELRALKLKYQNMYASLYEQRAVETREVPNFWVQALLGNKLLRNYISSEDEEALGYLTDVRCVLFPNSESFTLEFEFNSNPFFANSVLKKHYFMTEEGIIERTKSSVIAWKREISGKSFFGLFKNLQSPKVEDLIRMNEEEEKTLYDDFEEELNIGTEFKEEFVPNAYKFYCQAAQ